MSKLPNPSPFVVSAPYLRFGTRTVVSGAGRGYRLVTGHCHSLTGVVATATEQAGRTRLTQTALFEPKGFWGVAYWYALAPLHALIFGGMVRAIAKRARLGYTSS